LLERCGSIHYSKLKVHWLAFELHDEDLNKQFEGAVILRISNKKTQARIRINKLLGNKIKGAHVSQNMG
jgi:hypothetical protein